MRKVGGGVLAILAIFSALMPIAAVAETSTYVMIGGDQSFVNLPGVTEDGVILVTKDDPGADFRVLGISGRPEAIYLDVKVATSTQRANVQVLLEPHRHPDSNDSHYPQPRLVPQSYSDLSAGYSQYLAKAELFFYFKGHTQRSCKARGEDHFEILEIERDPETDEVTRLAADLTLHCNTQSEEPVHVRLRFNSTIDDSATIALRELAQRVGKDSDLDGVPDAQDLCPGSDSYPTDRLGCTGSEEYLYRDSDGDGLRDSYDRCWSTPAGATTDSSGCSRDQFCKLIKNKNACIYADFDWDFSSASGSPKDCKWPSAAIGCVPR